MDAASVIAFAKELRERLDVLERIKKIYTQDYVKFKAMLDERAKNAQEQTASKITEFIEMKKKIQLDNLLNLQNSLGQCNLQLPRSSAQVEYTSIPLEENMFRLEHVFEQLQDSSDQLNRINFDELDHPIEYTLGKKNKLLVYDKIAQNYVEDMLLLVSLCACGEKKNPNVNAPSDLENEIPKEEEENKEEEVDYTQIQDSDKAVVCYVGQTCTSKDTGTIVIVSYDPSDDTVMKVMDYSYKVDGSFPTGFLTNTIIDDWFYDEGDMYDAQASLIVIAKPIDKISSSTLACVSFVGKYELDSDDKETAFTTENGYTCYNVSGQSYVLDIGLEKYYVHVEQCNSDAENGGMEFQDLKFEIILDQ